MKTRVIFTKVYINLFPPCIFYLKKNYFCNGYMVMNFRFRNSERESGVNPEQYPLL